MINRLSPCQINPCINPYVYTNYCVPKPTCHRPCVPHQVPIRCMNRNPCHTNIYNFYCDHLRCNQLRNCFPVNRSAFCCPSPQLGNQYCNMPQNYQGDNYDSKPQNNKLNVARISETIPYMPQIALNDTSLIKMGQATCSTQLNPPVLSLASQTPSPVFSPASSNMNFFSVDQCIPSENNDCQNITPDIVEARIPISFHTTHSKQLNSAKNSVMTAYFTTNEEDKLIPESLPIDIYDDTMTCSQNTSNVFKPYFDNNIIIQIDNGDHGSIVKLTYQDEHIFNRSQMSSVKLSDESESRKIKSHPFMFTKFIEPTNKQSSSEEIDCRTISYESADEDNAMVSIHSEDIDLRSIAKLEDIVLDQSEITRNMSPQKDNINELEASLNDKRRKLIFFNKVKQLVSNKSYGYSSESEETSSSEFEDEIFNDTYIDKYNLINKKYTKIIKTKTPPIISPYNNQLKPVSPDKSFCSSPKVLPVLNTVSSFSLDETNILNVDISLDLDNNKLSDNDLSDIDDEILLDSNNYVESNTLVKPQDSFVTKDLKNFPKSKSYEPQDLSAIHKRLVSYRHLIQKISKNDKALFDSIKMIFDNNKASCRPSGESFQIKEKLPVKQSQEEIIKRFEMRNRNSKISRYKPLNNSYKGRNMSNNNYKIVTKIEDDCMLSETSLQTVDNTELSVEIPESKSYFNWNRSSNILKAKINSTDPLMNYFEKIFHGYEENNLDLLDKPDSLSQRVNTACFIQTYYEEYDNKFNEIIYLVSYINLKPRITRNPMKLKPHKIVRKLRQSKLMHQAPLFECELKYLSHINNLTSSSITLNCTTTTVTPVDPIAPIAATKFDKTNSRISAFENQKEEAVVDTNPKTTKVKTKKTQ